MDRRRRRTHKHLGEFEQLVLLAVLRLGEEAYGVSIRREIEARTGRDVSSGAIYTTLERLEKRSFVVSRIGEPTQERGGRRRKFYQLEPDGLATLRRCYSALMLMSEGLRERLGPS